VAPLVYYTDGQWVWPSYLSYYLDQWQQLLPDDFYTHIQFPDTAVPDLGAVRSRTLKG
jgi:hypothetical protein